MDPNWTDSDQDIGSDNETYLRTPPSEPRKETNSILDSLQQVGEVLTQLVEHQKVLQDKNLKIMEKLINKSMNSFVLDDIPMFDGLKGSINFETWLLELDKAVEITGMNVSELAFSKSSGTPHKMIKRLRREKSWEFIKEKLQITYSKLATDVHASTDLNQNKQKRHEPLEDFIERFYQNYKRATGEDPAHTRNPHIINTFIRNLYNRDIRKRVSGTLPVDLQAAFNSAIKIQRKLKWFEGYEYVSDDDDDDKVVNVLDLNKDGMGKSEVPGLTGAAGIGPCFRCGGYRHFSKDCPTKHKDKPNPIPYLKTTTGQYIPLQLLNTNPPTLTQQITTQGVITPEAWAQIQERVNTLAENNQLIDKRQKTLGRSHEKLKKLTKSMHKTKSGTAYPNSGPKQQGKKSDERHDKKKVKFVTIPPNDKAQEKSKQVNIVQAQEIPSSSESKNEMSEMTLPDETSGSSDGSGKLKYFDLLSSMSEDDGSNSDSDGDE